MRREDLYNVTLEVRGTDGTIHRYSIDKKTGGAIKGKDTKYRPSNGLENQLSLGGPRATDNVTLTRLYDNEIRRGETSTPNATAHWLWSQAGRANVVVTQQPIDENGHNFGEAFVLTGKLVDVTPPPTDSESEKAAVIEFACSLETNLG